VRLVRWPDHRPDGRHSQPPAEFPPRADGLADRHDRCASGPPGRDGGGRGPAPVGGPRPSHQDYGPLPARSVHRPPGLYPTRTGRCAWCLCVPWHLGERWCPGEGWARGVACGPGRRGTPSWSGVRVRPRLPRSHPVTCNGRPMLMPAARAVTAISLRGIGAVLPYGLAAVTPQPARRFPPGPAQRRRVGCMSRALSVLRGWRCEEDADARAR
jgi:hypothetical protein